MLIPMSEARMRLHELVRDAADEDVIVLRHGRPSVVIVGYDRYNGLLDELEDLRDRLSVYESRETEDDLRVSWEKAKAELGLPLS